MVFDAGLEWLQQDGFCAGAKVPLDAKQRQIGCVRDRLQRLGCLGVAVATFWPSRHISFRQLRRHLILCSWPLSATIPTGGLLAT